jgi:hypothetical protein
MQKATWVKPVLVRKPVSETAGGTGSNTDAQGGEFPVGS